MNLRSRALLFAFALTTALLYAWKEIFW